MSELPEGVPPAVEPEPRESSSGVVVEAAPDGRWRVLLGLRSRRSKFMPSHLSFPGGVLEDDDRPRDAGAFERCATRELEEETGVRVDTKIWHAAGERTTPSMFPVRFHTRFFVALADRLTLPEVPPSPQEIEALRVAPADVVLAEWERGEARVPPPVLPILRVIAEAGEVDLEVLVDRIRQANDLEERSPRIEFRKDLWMLPVRTATLPPATHTNVWMPGRGRFAVVDPGSTQDEENRRLLEVIARRSATGGVADSVVLTHHHQDHVGGVARIARELDLPVRAHPETMRSISGGMGSDASRLVPLNDGDEIDLAGVILRAHHTPGHASGHLALEIVGTGDWLTGDLASGLSTILIHPAEGNMLQYLRSLEFLRAASVERLFPGHGPPLPRRALDKLIEHRRGREKKILEQLSPEAVPLSRIATEAYRDSPPQVPDALIEGQTLAHLLALEYEGRARSVDAERRMWVSS